MPVTSKRNFSSFSRADASARVPARHFGNHHETPQREPAASDSLRLPGQSRSPPFHSNPDACISAGIHGPEMLFTDFQ
jgi:hypothetical protein